LTLSRLRLRGFCQNVTRTEEFHAAALKEAQLRSGGAEPRSIQEQAPQAGIKPGPHGTDIPNLALPARW
jgi:hypothetical protein